MKENYVVLRVRSRGAVSAGSRVKSTRPVGIGSAPRGPDDVTVHVEDLGDKDIADMRRDQDVMAIAPVVPIRLIEPLNLNDPRAVTSEPAEGVAWGVKAVGADRPSKFNGSGIVVAVLDTGIDASHPAFAGVTLTSRNFTDEGPADELGHGTHCAATIFGRPVNGVRIGVAPGITHALIGKVLGKKGGSSAQIAAAIQWALDQGANIISMSLGIDFPGLVKKWEHNYSMPTELATSLALEGYRANVLLFERLASYVRAMSAFGKSAIIVAAAGNESQRNKSKSFVIGVSPPAVSEGIISVAALGRGPNGLDVADFSNRGALVSAPGVDVESAGLGSKGLVAMSGTSMATPHVAGVAALWAQYLAESSVRNFEQLPARLIGTATKQGLKEGIAAVDVGAGLVQAP